MKSKPLLVIVFKATGQNLQRCWTCGQCDEGCEPGMDLTVRRLIQGVLVNDTTVLESQTLWSSQGLGRANQCCPQAVDLEAVWLALREEGWRRGIVDAII